MIDDYSRFSFSKFSSTSLWWIISFPSLFFLITSIHWISFSVYCSKINLYIHNQWSWTIDDLWYLYFSSIHITIDCHQHKIQAYKRSSLTSNIEISLLSNILIERIFFSFSFDGSSFYHLVNIPWWFFMLFFIFMWNWKN
jgi:hypothetical protein